MGVRVPGSQPRGLRENGPGHGGSTGRVRGSRPTRTAQGALCQLPHRRPWTDSRPRPHTPGSCNKALPDPARPPPHRLSPAPSSAPERRSSRTCAGRRRGPRGCLARPAGPAEPPGGAVPGRAPLPPPRPRRARCPRLQFDLSVSPPPVPGTL